MWLWMEDETSVIAYSAKNPEICWSCVHINIQQYVYVSKVAISISSDQIGIVYNALLKEREAFTGDL